MGSIYVILFMGLLSLGFVALFAWLIVEVIRFLRRH